MDWYIATVVDSSRGGGLDLDIKVTKYSVEANRAYDALHRFFLREIKLSALELPWGTIRSENDDAAYFDFDDGFYFAARTLAAAMGRIAKAWSETDTPG